MDSDVTNSLEATANLIYLIRLTLDDPTAAVRYVDLADEGMKAIGSPLRSQRPAA
jgi:hypothetical protein